MHQLEVSCCSSSQLSKFSSTTAAALTHNRRKKSPIRENQVQTSRVAEYLISHRTRRLKFNHVPVTQINLFCFLSLCTWQLFVCKKQSRSKRQHPGNEFYSFFHVISSFSELSLAAFELLSTMCSGWREWNIKSC